MDEFIATSERKAVVAEFEKAQAHLERAAELLSEQGYRDRAQRTVDIAQRASNEKHLLALDWRDEDVKAA